MNKYWLIGILIQLLFAEDLIVDQSSLESYEQDNYIIFDPYGGGLFWSKYLPDYADYWVNRLARLRTVLES